MADRSRSMSRGRPRKRARSMSRPRGLSASPMMWSAGVSEGGVPSGFIDIEKKFIDYETADDAFATTWAAMEDGTANCISATAQGDGESNRDGRVYYIRSVHIRGIVKRVAGESGAAPVADEFARVALVWDTQTNGAQLTATDVFDGGQTDDYLAFRNLQYSKRFIVLKDKSFLLKIPGLNEGASNLFATGEVKVPFKWNINFKKPIKVRCSGTTAVVGSITDNSLHVVGVATSTSCQLDYQSRIRFTD